MDQHTQQTAALVTALNARPAAAPVAGAGVPAAVVIPRISATAVESIRLHEEADALPRYPVTIKGTKDDPLSVFSVAWETERR